MPRFCQCNTKYAFDSPHNSESSEVRAHFTAQSLPTWSILERTGSSFCPWFCTVNISIPIVWIWFCLIMAEVLRLPASAICLQAGDVRGLPKWILQSVEITAGVEGRQVCPHVTPEAPSEFPHSTWERASPCTRWDTLRLLFTFFGI